MGKGTPGSMPVIGVSGPACAEVRDNSGKSPAWQRLWAVLPSRASLRAEQGPLTLCYLHWPPLHVS